LHFAFYWFFYQRYQNIGDNAGYYPFRKLQTPRQSLLKFNSLILIRKLLKIKIVKNAHFHQNIDFDSKIHQIKSPSLIILTTF